jgi:hypothetical protein
MDKPRAYRRWTPEDTETLKRMWAAGKTEGQIALKLKRTSGQVGGRIAWLRAHGHESDFPRRDHYNGGFLKHAIAANQGATQ